ncbi:MAG TPA: hypothetical protein VIW70_08490 [Rubrivivax sp.]
MTTITTIVPAVVRTPRAAPAAAWLFHALLSAFQRHGEARSARVKVSRRRAEAAATRRYALGLQRQDPRFAADLLAAADRHEQATD